MGEKAEDKATERTEQKEETDKRPKEVRDQRRALEREGESENSEGEQGGKTILQLQSL